MKSLKEIYDIENEKAIREYLGLGKEIYDKYWGNWKSKIKEVITIAKKHNAEYVFENDFSTFFTKTKRRMTIITTLYGITIYKENKGSKKC